MLKNVKDMVTEHLKLKDVMKSEQVQEMAKTLNKSPDDLEFVRKFFVADIKAINETERTVDAYVTTADIDRDGEILTPGGWDLSFYIKNPVVLYGHNYNILPDGSIPITGHNISIAVDGNGLLAKTKYNDTKIGEQVFRLRQSGDMRAYSVGFIPLEWTNGDEKSGIRRTYTKQIMLEYSDVVIPCNPYALQRAIKSGNMKLEPEFIKDLGIDENLSYKTLKIKVDKSEIQFSLDGKIWGVNEPDYNDNKWFDTKDIISLSLPTIEIVKEVVKEVIKEVIKEVEPKKEELKSEETSEIEKKDKGIPIAKDVKKEIPIIVELKKEETVKGIPIEKDNKVYISKSEAQEVIKEVCKEVNKVVEEQLKKSIEEEIKYQQGIVD